MTMRKHFSNMMNDLQRYIAEMGSLVVEALEQSIEALVNQDVKLAQEIIERDESINQLEIKIKDQCSLLIAEEQPVAGDLRMILNAIRISHSLERIGDDAVHVCKTTIILSKEMYMKPLIDIPVMAKIAIDMVKDALDVYKRFDVERAEEISKRDQRVDEIYSQVFRELLTYMHEDPSKISQAMSLLFVCRRLERVADQVTHICEGIVYVVTGEHVELNR